MAIDVDRDREFFPAIEKIMAKLKDMDDKIDLVKSNSELQLKTVDKFLKKVK